MSVEATTCIDCNRDMAQCACEDVLRCSCGIPSIVCVCAGDGPPTKDRFGFRNPPQNHEAAS